MQKNEWKRIKHETIDGIEHKLCSCCKEWKPATLEYFVKGSKWDGFHPFCKQCLKAKRDSNLDEIHARNKEKRQANIEEYRKNKLDSYYRNRDKILARNKELYYLNHEKELAKEAVYRETHKEYLSFQQSKYGKTPKGKMKYHRRKAKLREVEFSLTVEQAEQVKKDFSYKCAYCESSKDITLDHFIPLKLGGETGINNIIPACRSCNGSKSDRNFFEWYPGKSFYSKQRELKILQYLDYDPKTRIQQLSIL